MDDLKARLEELREMVDLTEVFDEISSKLACCIEQFHLAYPCAGALPEGLLVAPRRFAGVDCW
jgi:hypothetical protein